MFAPVAKTDTQMTTETAQIITTVKRHLRARGLHYRDVALGLGVSEVSVKRLFANGRFTLDRLEEVCRFLGLTLAELVQDAAAAEKPLRTLDEAQEQRLVSDERLMLVAVCALNHWKIEDIVAAYRLTRAECLKLLLTLDRMGLIALLPGDRIRVLVARDFDWLPDGPIRHYFLTSGLGEFLEGGFADDSATLEFAQGMLTKKAREELALELRRLKSRFAALHAESASEPLTHRRGTGLVMGAREWEPRMFARLRRDPG